jgi:hypothetical protein
MRVNDTPEFIRRDLIERLGPDAGEEEITAEAAFDEFCEWNGLVGWGPVLRDALYDLKQAEFQAAD